MERVDDLKDSSDEKIIRTYLLKTIQTLLGNRSCVLYIKNQLFRIDYRYEKQVPLTHNVFQK